MFTPARIVVVDDNPDHLKAIKEAVEAFGSSCVCLQYTEEHDLPATPFERARVIFMDLNLRSRQASSSFAQHFAEIQRLLIKLIPVDGGPFLLIVWTDRPGQVEALETYLQANLYEKYPYARPVKLMSLSKTEFINLDSGVVSNPGALQDRVLGQLESVPALAALLKWETDIIQASDRVVHDILALASAAPVEGAPDLAVALRRLATEAVGDPNVANDARGAIHSALLPLLQDHVQHEVVMEEEPSDVWSAALAGTAGLPQISRAQAANLNSRLHLGGTGGPLIPTTWGAICQLEEGVDWPGEFGIDSSEEYVAHLFRRIKAGGGGALPNVANARLLQVRIGAACDYAQRSDGPVPFVLGAFMPAPVHQAPKEGQQPKRNPLGPIELMPGAPCWLSPLLTFGEWGFGHLIVDPRFLRTRGGRSADGFAVVDRLREQLLMELIATVAQHGARPGIVRFLGQDVPSVG